MRKPSLHVQGAMILGASIGLGIIYALAGAWRLGWFL